jgi:energy-coupling factor transporter ATP-binding protein EcfA2
MIREFQVDKSSGIEDGLDDFRLRRLKNTVVLAGPNGAGKSRILKRLEKLLNSRVDDKAALMHLDSEILRKEEQLRIGEGDASTLQTQLEKYRKNRSLLQTNIQSLVFEGKSEDFAVERFVPNNTKLIDAGGLSQNDIRQRAKRTENFLAAKGQLKNARNHDTPTIANLNEYAMPVIHHVTSQYYVASHPNTPRSEEEFSKAQKDLDRLNELLKALLGTETKMIDVDKVELFGRPFNPNELSEGQSVLLQLAVALFRKGRQFDNMILIMDEPETHLHPRALLDFVSRIRQVIGNGQIWIATHSLPLLAHVPKTVCFIYTMEELNLAEIILNRLLTVWLGTLPN